MIAPRCMFFDWNHLVPGQKGSLRESSKELVSSGPIIIEKDSWIGAGSIILSGVTIGHGSVVGAGSVVTKSVPPFSIVAGNPARVIRRR